MVVDINRIANMVKKNSIISYTLFFHFFLRNSPKKYTCNNISAKKSSHHKTMQKMQ